MERCKWDPCKRESKAECVCLWEAVTATMLHGHQRSWEEAKERKSLKGEKEMMKLQGKVGQWLGPFISQLLKASV